MRIIGLTCDSQPEWSGLLLRTSADFPATFEKTRIDSLPIGGFLSSYCGQSPTL